MTDPIFYAVLAWMVALLVAGVVVDSLGKGRDLLEDVNRRIDKARSRGYVRRRRRAVGDYLHWRGEKI